MLSGELSGVSRLTMSTRMEFTPTLPVQLRVVLRLRSHQAGGSLTMSFPAPFR
jgi:hypothetical protein